MPVCFCGSQQGGEEDNGWVRDTLKAVLRVSNLEEDVWHLASLPLRLGGLGVRDAELIRQAARFASLVNVTPCALELGADEGTLRSATEEALRVYYAALDLPLLDAPLPQPHKDLQATLSEPLVLRRRSAVLAHAPEDDLERLNSLATTHLTAWTAGSPVVNCMSAE